MSGKSEIKRKYLRFFEDIVDSALKGETQRVLFSDNILLEVYLEGDQLHWSDVSGKLTRRPGYENN